MRNGMTTNLRIRQEALRLFVERGVDAVSVRDIAAAAGIQPSTLYVHWPSREALVADLFVSGFSDYAERLAAVDAGPVPQRVAAMVRLICRLEAEDRLLFRFLLLTQHVNLAAVSPDDRSPIEVLQRVIASGDPPPGDPALLTAAIVGIVVQAATFRVYGRIHRSLEDMADEIVELCLKLL